MIAYLVNQCCLVGFNLINSRIDAYRILKDKAIAHGVNFISYAVFSIILYWLANKPEITWCKFPYIDVIVYCMSAFCNRQLSFDIPLNLRRHLPWYHQSAANPPKAWWDKVERRIFGIDYDGKKIVFWYSMFYSITIAWKVFL